MINDRFASSLLKSLALDACLVPPCIPNCVLFYCEAFTIACSRFSSIAASESRWQGSMNETSPKRKHWLIMETRIWPCHPSPMRPTHSKLILRVTQSIHKIRRKANNPMVNQSMPSSVPGHMIQKRRRGRRGVRAKAVLLYKWRPLPGENPEVQKHQKI